MTKKAITWPLAGINFFLADVRDGLGPFLAIYLISTLQWHSDLVGIAMFAAGMATLILQTPAGAIMDATRYKRTILIASSLLISIAMLILQTFPTFNVIIFSKILVGSAGAFFMPGIAAITLGSVGATYYAKQVGTNEAFNHMGNIFAAFMAAAFGYYLGLKSLFWFTAIMGVGGAISVLTLKNKYIDNRVARGLKKKKTSEQPIKFWELFQDRTLLIFCVCILLFHLANAAMLMVIGEEIAINITGTAAIFFVAGSIISAQLVMFLMALLVRKKVDVWGRRPLFLIGFIALPIRGLLFMVSSDPYYLLGVQLLDGVGAGLYGALVSIVTADLMKGTGRYNLALGTVRTMEAIGAAVSNLLSGFIVVFFGFKATFLFLSVIAVIALFIFWIGIPETKNYRRE